MGRYLVIRKLFTCTYMYLHDGIRLWVRYTVQNSCAYTHVQSYRYMYGVLSVENGSNLTIIL